MPGPSAVCLAAPLQQVPFVAPLPRVLELQLLGSAQQPARRARQAACAATTARGSGRGSAPSLDAPPPLPAEDDSEGPLLAAAEEDGIDATEAGGRSYLQLADLSDTSLQARMVQWYPGHIARAERQLRQQLGMVDVVLEVRDARIPASTCHPQVPQWVGAKTQLLLINRADEISREDRAAWADHFKATGVHAFWTDGRQGEGVKRVRTELLRVAAQLNVKRAKRGLQPRAVRACVIGFPNIGKSALINRLLGRRVVASAPKPGVTRVLRWVRVDAQLELLDAPGVIPARFNDQIAAQRLAICNDIGEAAYLDSAVAACLVLRIKQLLAAERARGSGAAAAAPEATAGADQGKAGRGGVMAGVVGTMRRRYSGIDVEAAGSAEDFVVALGEAQFHGDVERAGCRLLNDYRAGILGRFAIELPDDVRRKAERDAVLDAAAQAREDAAAGGDADGGGDEADGDDASGEAFEGGGRGGSNSEWVTLALAKAAQQQEERQEQRQQ